METVLQDQTPAGPEGVAEEQGAPIPTAPLPLLRPVLMVRRNLECDL